MPLSSFRLARLWLASGLMIVTTFTSAWAQETPVDPNYQDVVLPEKTVEGFHPVQQLATPENDYANCAPAPASWHPPILYPSPEVCCPTGVVHRDWAREHSTGHWLKYRQRMLEKDYAWRVKNGHQPTCCPPWSSWGHKQGSLINLCSHETEACGNGCGVHGCADQHGCTQGCATQHGCIPQTSAVQGAALQDVDLASGENSQKAKASATDPRVADDPQSAPAMDALPSVSGESGELDLTNHKEESGVASIELISEDQVFANNGANGSVVETAGFCEVSDGCAPSGGSVYSSYGPYGYSDDCWEECEDDWCHCPLCCLKRRLHRSRDCFSKYLREDGDASWKRKTCPMGHYWLAYPVNPYHFDQRDGRIYGAQGYGHAVAVPLAPNVEHTFNYGWGLPSSRLTPISRMPGAPGVAIPAVPGAVGPGVLPPAYPSPLTSGQGR